MSASTGRCPCGRSIRARGRCVSCYNRAHRAGELARLPPPTYGRGVPKREVRVAVLQQAFRDSGADARTVALRLGWTHRGSTGGNGSRVLQAIGLLPCPTRNQPAEFHALSVGYHRAVRLIDAMGLNPVEYGL